MANEMVKRGAYPINEWDPFRMMREMMRWAPFREEQQMWMPHFEVRENGNSIRILADVPGIKREDLEISLHGNRLTVSGKREAEQRGKDDDVHTWERQYGEFTRTFALPDNVDIDHVTSGLHEGVLTIVAPLTATSKARKIPVGGAQPRS